MNTSKSLTLSKILILLTLLIAFVFVAFLAGCAEHQLEGPATTQANTPAATVAPMQSTLAEGGISMSLLHITPRSSSPGSCDASVFGVIAADEEGKLCVCENGDDHLAHWTAVGANRSCWVPMQ